MFHLSFLQLHYFIHLHLRLNQVFYGVLGTRFESLELQIGSLESKKIIIGSLKSEKIGSLESEKIGSLESEKSGPTDPNRVPNIFLKKDPGLNALCHSHLNNINCRPPCTLARASICGNRWFRCKCWLEWVFVHREDRVAHMSLPRRHR